MARWWQQTRLLLWKDYLMRKRKLVTLGGVLWATIIMLCIYSVRINTDNQDFPTCQYPARALPSAGMMNFLQSFVCSINNECSPMNEYEEIPTYENSRFTQLQEQFSPILHNETILDIAGGVPNALKLLATLADVVDEPTFVEISKNGIKTKDLFSKPKRVERYISSSLNISDEVAETVMNSELSFQGILNGDLDRCSVNSMSKTLVIERSEHLSVFVNKLCSLSNEKIQKIMLDLIMEINFSKYIKMIGNMYSKLNGDNKVKQLANMLTAVLRMSKLESFIPIELINMISKGQEFSYFDLNFINKFMDLFEPTFGDTEVYKSLRDITDAVITAFQYLNKFLTKQSNNSVVNDGIGLVVSNVESRIKADANLLNVSKEISNVVKSLGEVMNDTSIDAFEILSKITDFILKLLPEKSKHDVLFYSTLLTKLIESAHKVIDINMHIEDIAYNVSLRNPKGVQILVGLPTTVLRNGFDALANAEKTQILTSVINKPGQTFCDSNRLQKFFTVSKDQANLLKKQLCTDDWKSYMSDLINSFGVFYVKDNVNKMASLLVQETIGKDTNGQLYTIDYDFKVLKIFTKSLIGMDAEIRPKVDWNKLFNVSEDSEFMKVAREKAHLGKQILITVHGALAKEIVKQNVILDYKITPVLIDATTLVLALNEQLTLTPVELAASFKKLYPKMLLAVLATSLDENRTYKSLSAYSEDIVCHGVDKASEYLVIPSDIDKEALITTLCNTSTEIERGLRNDSIVAKAIRSIVNSSHSVFDEVDWTKLINGLKELYLKLDKDYPYLFEFASYGMNEATRRNLDAMFEDAKQFWFDRENMQRSLHLSFKLMFRLLDILDKGMFGLSNEIWLKIKFSVSSVSGPLRIYDEFLKLVTALSQKARYNAELPPRTVAILTVVLPNVPQLIVETADMIVADDTDVNQIISLMNSEPAWPCANTSLAELLPFSVNSQEAVRSLETMFCMNDDLQHEWKEYLEDRNISIYNSKSWNTTSYEPNMFLKFSAIFDDLIEDTVVLNEALEGVLNESSSERTTNFITAIKYAMRILSDTNRELIWRKFFTKVDTVLNAMNTSTAEDWLPLNFFWEKYLKCSNVSYTDECRHHATVTWKHSLEFLSVMSKNIIEDLLTYFNEVNEPNSNLLQLVGFTKNTGLYLLYDKLPEFFGVLINSYWDYGFMSQIRRASHSEFWECEAVLGALVPPPDSTIDKTAIRSIQPFICPTLIYWISLPRGDNTLLDLVAKPQYFFYTLQVSNLSSNFEDAFLKAIELKNLLIDIANRNESLLIEENVQLDTFEYKLEKLINSIITFKINDTDPMYRHFNQISKKQITASIYLTRIVAIINKIATAIENFKLADVVNNTSEEELKKLQNELSTVQKKFKRRPTEIIAFHFDLLTDVIWNLNENYTIVNALDSMCNSNDSTKIILSDNQRMKNEVCTKSYKIIYGSQENRIAHDYKDARLSLVNLIKTLRNDETDNVSDIFKLLSERKQLINSLKISIEHAYELSIPIYLKYLQNNLQHYNVLLAFFSGGDWWQELRDLYNGTYANKFFDSLEKSFEIVDDVLTNLDKIHLLRLLRDININDTSTVCLPNITLSDYVPDSTGILSEFKRQVCSTNKTSLFKELPPLVFASQGYDKNLKLSKDVNYTALNVDVSKTESKLESISDGPRSPRRPHWVNEETLSNLKTVVLGLLSKETLTKISFGILGNIADGSTLFLNNSQCVLCSQFTTWFKQINLQLVKKSEYDNLLCHMQDMTMDDIYHSLKDDFHWDMTIKELISTRNYTKYELNKSVNQFLEQVKLYLLDDLASNSTKIADCLIKNVTKNAFGNATLFITTLAHTTKLLIAEMPHVQEIDGIKEIQFLKQKAGEIAHRLDVHRPLKYYLNQENEFSKELMKIIGDGDTVENIVNGQANLRLVNQNMQPIETRIKLFKHDWTEICNVYDCEQIFAIVNNNLNRTTINKELPILQLKEYWNFNFVTRILRHVESLLGHVARLVGVASKVDAAGVASGDLAATLDLIMGLLSEDTLENILYSLQEILKELHPLLEETTLEYDLSSLGQGLIALQQFKNELIERDDLKLRVSEVFPYPERMEVSLGSLGINHTNFWSIAAPKIHAGYINLKPIISSKRFDYHISSFVCQPENMSKVILPSNLDVVNADDVYGATIEQFCGLNDEQAKRIIPVLLENLNFSFVIDKIKDILLLQLYVSSNLTPAEGATVMNQFPQMATLLPLVQENIGNLSETLAKEPLFQSLGDFNSIGGLLSSPKFLSSAGNMLCGKPFAANDNRFYKAIAETKDFSNEPDQMQLDVLPTDFCRSLYKDILKMNGGKIVWSFVKPLIMGKILYTPPTPAVHRIIQEANSTFASMVRLASLVHSFANAFSSVDRLSEHREGLDVMRRLISSPAMEQLRVTLTGGGELPDVNVEGFFEEFGDLKDVGRILSKASDLLHCINMNRFQAARDEYELTHEAVILSRVNEFSAGLVFTNVKQNGEVPTNIEYKIRMDIENVPTTTRIRNQFWTPGPEASFLEDMRYFRGFIQIQDIVDKAIVKLALNSPRRIQKRETDSDSNLDWAVYTQQIPYPCYRRDLFQSSLYESQALIVGFFFSLLFTVASAVRFVVSDNESGNTMLMSVMGVSVNCHTCSWFVASLVELVLTIACIAAVLCAGGVVPRTDPTLLFVLLLIFGYSVLMFCYMLSKLFTSASFAAVCAAIAYLMSFMPYVIILSLEAVLSNAEKLCACLSMSTAFSYGILHVARYEAIGVGAHWCDLWRSPSGDDMSIGLSMIMMIVDGVLYLAVGCLIDHFFGIKTLKSNITYCSTTGEKAGVSIVNVSKVYSERSRRPKLALDNVSIELHKGQITTLLGHNGAGKTTLIKILTGMLKPTKGHVIIRSEHARGTRLGVCPQKDVLFECLSAKEHIALYAQLKSGLKPREVRDEVESLLQVLCLGNLSREPVHRLSGGTRRRLCVALAFVARPHLVSLDEPTSGVDPAARLDIWSLIVKLKEDRTVLLTTHHLDEAELLSDQIVIMHKGQIHTIGSPIDIKRTLGNGYKLTVTYPKKVSTLNVPWANDDEDLSMEGRAKQLLTVVRDVVRNAQLVDVTGLDVEINLPFFDTNGLNNNYLQLCTSLESRKQALDFRHYSLDCSNLEQVFFNICQRADETNPVEYGTVSSNSSADIPSKSASNSSIRNDIAPLVNTDGPIRGTAWRQFLALLRIRYLHYTRNRWLLFLLIVLPSLFVAIAMGFSTIRPPADNELPLKLNPQLYPHTTDFIVARPSVQGYNADSVFAQNVMNTLKLENNNTRNWIKDDSPSCECTEVRQQCNISENNSKDVPEMMVLPDVHTLNDWLVASQEIYIEKRYGGFTSSVKKNSTRLTAWYNNKGHHAMPSYLNAFNSALLKTLVGNDTANITTYTHPLKISTEQLSKSTVLQHIADMGISGLLLVAYCLVTAGSAIYLVSSRTSQEKRLQLLCGVSPALYWTTALVWDMIIMVINILITVGVLEAFGFPIFVSRNNLPAICILLFLFGYASNCLVHLTEKMFSEASMANMMSFCANVFCGLVGIAVLLILDLISESETTDNARWYIHKVFMLSPQFVLGDALIEIAKNTVQAEVLSRFGMDTYKDPLSTNLIAYHYLSLIVVGTILFVTNLAVEYDCFETIISRFRPVSIEERVEGEMEELDVTAERARVLASAAHAGARPVRLPTIGNINAGFVDTESKKGSIKRIVPAVGDIAQCLRLGKAYAALSGRRVAVRGLTLGIPPGQCTALLGQNGAGKSTTFAMLTGQVRPSAGHIYLNNKMVKSKQLCTGLISYCPQSDAIDPLLTVKETLQFYCQLRGIADQDEVIRRTMNMFDLSNYAEVRSGALSGGNKRKLCTAIAFMGRAPLVLLDEPTSGMDPNSRICVSRGVQSACASQRAVLLSTHALDDARRLAQRVALMRDGRLCALATVDECLTRFGGGYTVSCRVPPRAALGAWRRVRGRAPHAQLRAARCAALQLHLPLHAVVDNKEITTKLSDIFRMMAELQSTCDIEDYTVCQSSLDQMFLSFAEKADDNTDTISIEELPSPHVLRRNSEELSSITAL